MKRIERISIYDVMYKYVFCVRVNVRVGLVLYSPVGWSVLFT